MADAVHAIGRIVAQRVLEIDQLAGGTPKGNTLRADERNARGVVSPVFHAAQPIQQDGHDRFRADVSDDSAHTSQCAGFPASFRGVVALPD